MRRLATFGDVFELRVTLRDMDRARFCEELRRQLPLAVRGR
jgi:hypothetical protein